jgi:hypothetical protein
VSFARSVAGVVGVLNNNQTELLVGRNHDLVFLRPDSDESDGFFLVYFLDARSGLVEESADDLAVINSVVLAHG